MKHSRSLAGALICLFAISACGGGDDKPKLAQQTVHDYWADIGHAKFPAAYAMLTSGVQAQMTEQQFEQSMFALVQKTNGVFATTDKPTIDGDHATVPVGLHASVAPGGAFHVYQHLFWENGAWKISEPHGGVSQTK